MVERGEIIEKRLEKNKLLMYKDEKWEKIGQRKNKNFLQNI